MKTQHRHTLGILGFALFLALWALASLLVGQSFLLPSPLAVARHLIENRRVLFGEHFAATAEVIVLGGLFSLALGALFAVVMDAWPLAARALYPILTLSQSIPTLCLAPVLVLFLGYSVAMRVVVVVLMNFFAVTVSLYDGLQSTGAQETELLKSLGATPLQRLLLLRLPTALPALFTSLRIALPWSVVGAAIAEWLGAPRGLGTYSRKCMAVFDAAGLLAPLVILTALALILTFLLRLAEHRALRWSVSADAVSSS